MYRTTVFNRKISKRMRLHKTTREIYTHINLEFFSDEFNFKKSCLLLTGDILKYYNTVLYSKLFNFIICSCELREIEEDTKRKYAKMNPEIVFFKDEFVEEVFGLSIYGIAEYLKMKYPSGHFDVLSLQNLSHFAKNNPSLGDVLFSVGNPEVTRNLMAGKTDEILFNNFNKNSAAAVFEPFLENLDFHHKNGRIIKGTLIISPLNCREGEVIERDRRIKIDDRSMNRALHGDEVYAENNKIVGIYKRKKSVVVGTLFEIKKCNEMWNIGRVRPIDRRYPDVEVMTFLQDEFLFRKVILNIVEWEPQQKIPRGVIFKILGENGNFEDEIRAITEHYSIEYVEEKWDDVIAESRKLDPQSYDFSIARVYDDVKLGKRKDLRELEICSIDPKGCTDIDDALHCIRFDDCIEIGVHIADVSFYVPPESFLDKKSRNRSTTVYFPDRRIDMLPPFLSSGLCSLLENQDRAAFSCVWKMDFDFNIVETRIFKSLIRSKAALSYEDAYEIISGFTGNPMTDPSPFNLNLLMEVSKKMRRERFEKGALDLSAQELYFDSKKNLRLKESIPTHSMVEEFMLLANITVANYILRNNTDYSLLRRHPLPSAIELDYLDCTNSKTLNDSLLRLDPDHAVVLKRIITRSMQQAIYFSSGDTSDYYHYGLAVDVYTHFTSPIRRYPDIVVHRTLEYILEGNYNAIDGLKEYVDQKSCSLMNFRHRNSRMAAMMVNELCLAMTIEEGVYDGIVVSVKDNGIVVFIREYGMEGFIECIASDFKLFDCLKIKIVPDFADFCVSRRIKMYNLK